MTFMIRYRGPGARLRRHHERLGIRRLDPVVGGHVNDHTGPVSPPGEVVRGMPPPTPLARPVQPERLRRDTGDLRIEIERPDKITLQSGLIADVPAGRRGPPPAREMPKPVRPAELAHRHPVLEPDLRTRGQRRPPLDTAAVNESQLESGTSGPHPPAAPAKTDITYTMIPNRANYGGKTRRTSKMSGER